MGTRWPAVHAGRVHRPGLVGRGQFGGSAARVETLTAGGRAVARDSVPVGARGEEFLPDPLSSKAPDPGVRQHLCAGLRMLTPQ